MMLSKGSQIFSVLARGCVRIAAIVAIVTTYGLGQLGIIGASSLAITAASTTPAHAWWRGRGWGRGWGWRGWRGWRRW